MWGGGWWHQVGVLCPWLPLVGRLAYMTLVGGHNSLVPLNLAWVSISGTRAGYFTKFILFSNSQAVKNSNIEIFLDSNNENEFDPSKCVPIIHVLPGDDIPAVRFLGVYFDPNLNFQFHIKTSSSKLSKALYILRSSNKNLMSESLKAIYYSIFHCYLIYCVPL